MTKEAARSREVGRGPEAQITSRHVCEGRELKASHYHCQGHTRETYSPAPTQPPLSQGKSQTNANPCVPVQDLTNTDNSSTRAKPSGGQPALATVPSPALATA